MPPDNWLSCNSNNTKLLKFPNSTGILPTNSFVYRYKECRLLKDPSSVGILPVS